MIFSIQEGILLLAKTAATLVHLRRRRNNDDNGDEAVPTQTAMGR